MDEANLQSNKSTIQIWVVTHRHFDSEFLGSFLGCYDGGGGEAVVASGNVGFFYFSGSEFSVLKFASIRTKPSQRVKEDQRNLNCKSFSSGMMLSPQREVSPGFKGDL